jgi:hypothetical protein
MPDTVTSTSGSNKRQRLDPRADTAPVGENSFIQDNDAADSGADDDDDEERPKDKKAGRRKIKIEFIQDKSRRHITFSKRKAGIMKKVPSSPSLLSRVFGYSSLFVIRLMSCQR